MLYSTLSQPLVFLCILASGLAGGLTFVFTRLISFACKNNKAVLQIGYFFSALSCAAIFYFVNLAVNYGELRFFALATFVIAVTIMQFVLSKTFGKLFKLCYNKFHARGKNKKNS